MKAEIQIFGVKTFGANSPSFLVAALRELFAAPSRQVPLHSRQHRTVREASATRQDFSSQPDRNVPAVFAAPAAFLLRVPFAMSDQEADSVLSSPPATPTRESMDSYATAASEPATLSEEPEQARPGQTEPEQADPAQAEAEQSQSLPRLAIANLRLENFKSYGGVVNVGPFHKSFSAVVGPNGSGKSNVIDAMLFVFGRRAKQLRHSKLRELLHHSDTFPDVSSATVTVFFHEIVDTGEGDMDYRVVDGSLFSVARRAFRNDTSKYYLNEREVKMTQVVDLLKSKGVDLDNNRFLILQGEVEQISMMKPKATTPHEDGLLEYLEDIIGSNRHVEAISESAKQVEALNEERSHKLNRVKAAERERDGLEDSKNEAEDYMDKERELLTKRLRVSRAAFAQRREDLEEQKAAKEAAVEKLENARSSLKEAESRAGELQQEFAEKKQNADTISDQLNAAKEKYATTDRADIQLGTDLKAIKAKEKKLKATVERETKRAKAAEVEAEEKQAELQEAESTIESLQEESKRASEELDQVHASVRKATEPLRAQLEENQEKLLPLKDTVNKFQRDADVTSSERDLLFENLDAPKKALEEATDSLGQLKEELTACVKPERDRLFQSQAELKANVSKNRSALSAARDSEEQLGAKVSGLRGKLEEAKQAAESSVSTSKLFAALYSASREGKLSGIVGRLGDLGTISEEYGIAAGAAAGASLDNMVVRTADDAQACINFMRQRNLGRSTFIILEKLSYLKDRMNPKKFDGPRLFDFVRVEDERNKIAFYLALKDTLVAPSLEEARRMAFKPTRQNRVVTHGGELIEASGAMTGGGRGPPKHRLASKSSNVAAVVGGGSDAAATNQLARDLDNAVRARAEAADECQKLLAESRDLVMGLEEVNTELTKVSNQMSSLEGRIAEVTSKSLPQLRKAAADIRKVRADKAHPQMKKLKDLEARMTKTTEALDTAKNACVGRENAIAKIQDEIVAAGGQELQDAKEALENAKKAISERRSAVSSSKSRAAVARKTAKSAYAAVEKASKEIEQALLDREELLKKRTEIEDEAEVLVASFKDLEELHNSAVEEVKALGRDHSAVKAKLKKGRQSEVPLVEKVSDATRLVSACEHDLRGLRKTIKSLNRKLQSLVQAASDAALPDSVPATDESEDKSGEGDDTAVAEDNENGDEGSEAGEAEGMDVDAETNQDEDDESCEPEDAGLSEGEMKKLKMEIAVLEDELSKTKPNLGAIAEYRRKNAEYQGQVGELDELSSRRDVARKENDGLRKARLDEFMQGFSVITLKLKELYQMITLGGDAELELVDSLDPFSEGIVFSVRPPKKSWKNISNLSGGEKTLSSLALVFALHHFKPTPLYFLDEIDAALDFKNVSIVANYVKERTKNAQFIIISLRNNMFELADRLVGIYKTHNTTKSVTVNPKAFTIPSTPSTASTVPTQTAR